MKGHIAGSLTLAIAVIIAVAVYKMPLGAALSATVLGIVNGLFPIGWIVITAVFLFNLVVESGQFEVIKSSISTLSGDRRIQALLIAFSFSAFMEGTSGQGAPVAIAAAMLIGLGFKPLPAALLCLIANVPPVPFGPVGTPTIMMSTVTGLSGLQLAQSIGREMFVFAFIIPTFMLVVMAGWKSTKEVLPAIFVTGGSFAVTYFLVTNLLGPDLPAIAASIVSIVSLAALLRVWQPKTIWRFADDASLTQGGGLQYSGGQIFKAWSPFLVLMVIMGIWGVPAFKNFVLKDLQWFVSIKSWPGLDGIVYKSAPIVAEPAKYAASYRWDFFSAAGTAMLITAIVTMLVLKIKPATGIAVFGKTFKQLAYSLITIGSVIGLAYLANYSGISYTLGLAFAATGKLFPVFSPVVGWLGVFLTGSVTSSAALFGKLQQVTAGQLGLNPLLTTSANLLGGCMGKLISPQSIAIAAAATGLVGKETEIFRSTYKYSLMLLAMVIIVILILAYIVPGVLPVPVPPAG
jgi:lactate permease